MKASVIVAGSVGAVLAASPFAVAKAQGQDGVPRAVTVARTTGIPGCTVFVDAAAANQGNGTVQSPHRTIAAAVAAARPGAVICVAEGTYSNEQIRPREKHFILAGGFQRGSNFKVRDSAAHVTRVTGKGGSFIRIEDPGPRGKQRTVIDGFDISGYSQAIVRDFYESQLFDITNNHIHDNRCANDKLAGAGVALNNISGRIQGNVFRNNACGRGGAVFTQDTLQQNTVTIESNWIDNNHGTEPSTSHGGAVYVFGRTLRITGNLFTRNSVTQWGGGLYVGAWTEGKHFTTANLNWNVYRDNRAGNGGGGMFCDDGATCNSYHEVYDGNCGSNIYLDSGTPSGPTRARFQHLTNVRALAVDCKGPGAGVRIDNAGGAPDTYSFINALFWNNAPGTDFVATCDENCGKIRVTVSHSMVQTKYRNQGVKIAFGDGIVAPVDPLFADPANGDFHLRSQAGRWTPKGRLQDSETSPAIGRGYSEGKATGNPPGAGDRIELGAYGNSAEASYAQLGAPQPSASQPSAPQPSAPQAQAVPPQAAPPQAAPAQSGPPRYVPPRIAAPQLAPPQGQGFDLSVPPTEWGKPAIARGASYMGFPERFNRYYTEPDWKPSRTIYVSADGRGDGATPNTPMSVAAGIKAARPGARIHFQRGRYEGCFDIPKSSSGTYDAPIVLYGERNPDHSLGVSIACCKSGRQTCINMEFASYIAVDGFELIGGNYGVRAVGEGYAASQHSRGTAVMNNIAHDQFRDPIFSGQVDWAVWEGNVAYNAGKGDGHGIYLSNGGDWNIVRFNETYSNVSSDFQINADPASTCREVGIPFNDPRCDAYAGTGEGGQGASDYFLIDSNYFHHGAAGGVGPNFTSVRRSVVRNNIFGFYPRHGASFWQETDNPRLGASDNRIVHNLFITTGRPAVQFNTNSTRNEFANNLLLGVRIDGGKVSANPQAVLMEVDGTAGANTYRSNVYIGGRLTGRTPNAQEVARPDFSPAWFARFPAAFNRDPNDFRPAPGAPFLGLAAPSPYASTDRNGVARKGKATPGPIEPR